MYRSVFVLSMMILLGACSQAPVAPAKTPEAAGPEMGTDFTPTANAFGIGDVDSAMQIAIRLGQRSLSPTVRADERETQLKKLSNVAINVFPPMPNELWLSMSVTSQIDFPGKAVLVSVKIFVDEKQTGTFSYAIGADAAKNPKVHEFNVLEGTDPPTATMLVRATADLTLYPNISPADIDVNNPPAAGPEDRGAILSNPVRIEFH